VDAGTMARLSDDVLEVPLYWQRWRLESDTLEALTDAIHAAAAVGLD
jgi:LysR family transcriptional regulator (chromosome initiation inhibitor)